MAAKNLGALGLFVLLAGCGDNTEYPTHICRERDIISGKCLKAEYICTSPMVLKPYYGGPLCVMQSAAGEQR